MTGTAPDLSTAADLNTYPSTQVAPSSNTDLVAGLAAEASALIDRLPGPLRRVRVQLGEAEVEVEWAAPEPVHPTFPSVPAVVPGGQWLSPPAPPAGPAAPVAAPRSAPASSVAEDGGPIPGAFVVEAPVVGVFYRSPSPDEPPFVELGEVVEVGQQLGIVEAMKLMNPIQAEVAGVLAAVHVETGQGVEFGQPLFEILPQES